MATVITFGKYSGQLITSLPDNYLRWMSRELDSHWKDLAIAVLNQRDHPPDQVSHQNGGRVRVSFGKFKGQFLDTLPNSQLEWMSKEMYSHWGKLAAIVLQERNTGIPRITSNIDSLKMLIKSSGDDKDLAAAAKAHEKLNSSIYSGDRYLANLIVEMHGKCGSVTKARQAFDGIKNPNVYSYNIMLKIYADNGLLSEAEKLFREVDVPSLYTWNIMLSAYAKRGEIDSALELFNRMKEKDVVSWTALLIAYISSGQIEQARSLFDGLKEHNAVTWNTMIDAYAQKQQMEEAKTLFDIMPHIKTSVTWNIMIHGYGLDGCVDQAKLIFDQVPEASRTIVTWNALLGAYAQNKHIEEAESLFRQMTSKDEVSWTNLLQGYCLVLDINKAKSTFEAIPSRKTCAHQTIMLQAYSKAADVTAARKMFDSMSQLDVITWNTMISAYAQNGYMRKAVSLFEKAPHKDLVTWNIMIFAYASTGCPDLAKALFDRMQIKKDVVTWNALCTGYTQNRLHEDALEVYRGMMLEGVNPNPVMLISVLTSSGEKADRCLQHFFSISGDFWMSPTLEHYNCMVDSLGRNKRFAECRELLENMPYLPDSRAWMTLLAACRASGNAEFGKYAAEQVFKLDPQNASPYVMLGEIYSHHGMAKELHALKKKMKAKRVQRVPACSLIEVGEEVHKFYVGDKSHPDNKMIRTELLRLDRLMKETGYESKPSNSNLVDLECKGDHHSEKLAVAYGVLACKGTDTLRVVNNIRTCVDCHESIKRISEIVGRKVVLTDGHVHHMKSGVCSCQDAW